jgi:basic amino acid/polyamine antiporter, APA family
MSVTKWRRVTSPGIGRASGRGATESTPSLFLRNATGLVRELSAFDAFNLVFAGVSCPIGFFEAMSFAPEFWPRADMIWAYLLAGPLCVFFALVYVYFTVIMPRSGGEYVWLSRTAHPFLGFVINVALTYVFLTWAAINLTILATVCAPAVALVTGTHASWLASPSKGEIAVFVTVLIALFTLLMIRGVRPMARYMVVLFAYVWIAACVLLVVLGTGSHSGFIHSWNTTAGTFSFTGIMTKAHGLGFSAVGGVAIMATLYAMIFSINSFLGFQWTGYFAGEVKNIRRSAHVSILGALAAAWIVCTIWAALIYKFYGRDFFGSLVYLGFGPGASHVSLPFAPYVVQLVHFLPVGEALQIGFVLMFAAVTFWFVPASFMLATRNLFAWSFDRLAPDKMADVSDRYHTPIPAIIFVAVIIEALVLLNIYSNLSGWLLSVIWVYGVMFVIISGVAAWLPWHKRKLHEQSPKWAQRRFLRVPVITWVGLASMVVWTFVVVAAFTTGFMSTSLQPMIDSVVVPVGAAVYYFAARYVRRRQGLDLSRVFGEIPPE